MTSLRTSTPFVCQPDLQNTVWYLGNLFTFLLTGQHTQNQLTLMHVTTARGNEPPPHTHSHEDEIYYVLAGELSVMSGDQRFHASAGNCVFLPCGLMHSFSIESEQVEMLVFLTPAGLEDYFRHPELSEPARQMSLPPPPEHPYPYQRSMELLKDYGVEMPPPPLPIA